MITAGIDCGPRYTKTVILKDDQVAGKHMQLTGAGRGMETFA